MSILVHQSLGCKGDEHLIGMATAERLSRPAWIPRLLLGP